MGVSAGATLHENQDVKLRRVLLGERTEKLSAGRSLVTVTERLLVTHSSELSAHWRFAASSAFRALDVQIREFEFARYADGHTFAGFDPQEYLEIIDGFLSEDSTVVPTGNRRALEGLRKLLVHHVIDAFQLGWQMAVQTWQETDRQDESLNTADLHALARKLSPFGSLKREWFIEGFSQSWAKTELESLRGS